VESVLVGLGYNPEQTSRRKHAGGYGERMWCPEDPAQGNVEVHWDLVNSPPLRRRVSVGFADLQFEDESRRRPSAASLLLMAAVHGAAGHRFDRLQILSDVCQAARGNAGEIDTEWLSQAIAETGSAMSLAAALGLAWQAFLEPRCAELLGRLGLPGTKRLWTWLLNPAVVVQSHERVPGLRRQLFRELLKRQ
jgi:hypothetical protein